MPETKEYKYLLIVTISVMLLLFVSFLIAFILAQRKKLQYQQHLQHLRELQQNQLIEAAVRTEETERHRIAETLHDEVGAILSSSKLHFQGIKARTLDERDHQLYEKGKELLDDAIQKVRGISHNLHSSILKEFGLNEALQHFIKKITHGTLINATTNLDSSYTTQNPEIDISIYRIVQELINNILKHAGSKQILVSSSYNDDQLILNVFHDGAGLTQQQFEDLRYKKDGLGLKNIQNRIIILKGNIRFSSDADGNRITMTVPVHKIIL